MTVKPSPVTARFCISTTETLSSLRALETKEEMRRVRLPNSEMSPDIRHQAIKQYLP